MKRLICVLLLAAMILNVGIISASAERQARNCKIHNQGYYGEEGECPLCKRLRDVQTNSPSSSPSGGIGGKKEGQKEYSDDPWKDKGKPEFAWWAIGGSDGSTHVLICEPGGVDRSQSK